MGGQILPLQVKAKAIEKITEALPSSSAAYGQRTAMQIASERKKQTKAHAP
jgi:hypothetical protein